MDSGRLAGRTHSAAPGQASSTKSNRSPLKSRVCVFVCSFVRLLSILPSPAVLSGARHSLSTPEVRETECVMAEGLAAFHGRHAAGGGVRLAKTSSALEVRKAYL